MDNIGHEIVKSFHEQFAQNQNHHQRLFLQVLAVLLSVLIGFGYLYIRVGAESKEVAVTIETVYAFLALSMCLLSLAIALILNMALGFRRDQMVAANIRVKLGLMKIDDKETTGFFPYSFNPVGKIGYLEWMPEFHKIFFVSLIIIKFVLILSLITNSKMSVIWDLSRINWLITGSFGIFIFSIIFDFVLAFLYWSKWVDYSKKAPTRLKYNENKADSKPLTLENKEENQQKEINCGDCKDQ